MCPSTRKAEPVITGMHRLFQRISVLTVFLAILALGAGNVAAGQNIVRSIDLEQLEQKLASDSGRCAIVFMAAWCMPCIEELPAVNELYEKYSASGLHIVGLSLDYGGPQAMQPFIDHHKVRFPVYWVGEKAIKTYQIRGIPLILLVKNGKITERIMGKRSKKDLDKIFAAFVN